MRRRWSYLKWCLWRKRSAVLGIIVLFIIGGMLLRNRGFVVENMKILYTKYGVRTVGSVMEAWIPHLRFQEEIEPQFFQKPKVLEYLARLPQPFEQGEDPAYERLLARVSITIEPAAEEIKMNYPDSVGVWDKLNDHDYVMKEFYVVHPTTTADGTLIDVEQFLNMDLSIEKQESKPQILIYHTHSQEEFSDHSHIPDATIVGVGTYLTELLEKRGYHVIHDKTVYDMKNGTLDRSQAYTYALDGINGILQKNPSIEVVLDLHRDGVDENTHLITEVNGKPTARIMFFNGTSQTPDGPIEYLQNPNREANLAFSFQLQLEAAEQYPGLTRKIYLKGLRYNQHVRARTALIEVGAQTNTYAEALNAMEPLADILCRVLGEE